MNNYLTVLVGHPRVEKKHGLHFINVLDPLNSDLAIDRIKVAK